MRHLIDSPIELHNWLIVSLEPELDSTSLAITHTHGHSRIVRLFALQETILSGPTSQMMMIVIIKMAIALIRFDHTVYSLNLSMCVCVL